MATGALYNNGTASAQIKATEGKVFGIVVNSHSSGTIKLWDSLTAANDVILNTFSVATGSQTITFAEPIVFNTALYLTVGGTIDYTVLYK